MGVPLGKALYEQGNENRKWGIGKIRRDQTTSTTHAHNNFPSVGVAYSLPPRVLLLRVMFTTKGHVLHALLERVFPFLLNIEKLLLSLE